MSVACLAGSTGLVGGNILKELLASSSFTHVHAFTRRDLSTDAKLSPIKSTDTSSWAASFPSEAAFFFSALGTTRAAAGGSAGQRKIDYDLALELATAAKQRGVKTYVVISSSGASSGSMFPYMKTKGDLDDKVQELGFDHCIILRPGLIMGPRDHLRLGEAIAQNLAKATGALGSGLKDSWAQDAGVIARAAISAALNPSITNKVGGVTILGQADIIRLGRTEWK